MVTLYKNTFSTEFYNIEPIKIAQGILTGQWKELVEPLRSLDEKAYKQAKTLLPCITWSGTFKERRASEIQDYSGLVVLDLDNLEEDTIQRTMSLLSNDEYVLYAFRSPSYKGLKIVCQVNTGPDHHLAAFLHLQKTFQEKYLLKIDDSGKDICRLCYVSYDPFAVLKERSTMFEVDTRYGEVKSYKARNDFANYKPLSDPLKIHELCVVWMEKGGMAYVSGQRNRYVHAVACAMNRCAVKFDDTVSILQSKYSDLDQKEVYGCVKSAYFHHQDEHGSYDVKDLDKHTFKAPAYVQNYTEDVVENDLMETTAMLHHHGVPMKKIGEVVAKLAKYYKANGMLDLDRRSLIELMNKAIQQLKDSVLKNSEQNTLKYESVEEMGMSLLQQNKVNGIIPTYLPELDEAMGGGLQPSSSYAIIGLGGTFKSFVLLYLCYANAANGVPCIYLNGEMGRMQTYERLFAMVFGVNLRYEMQQGRITEETMPDVLKKMNDFLGNNLHIVNGSGFNKQNIEATLDNYSAKYGKKIKLVAVDGLSQFDQAGLQEAPAAIYNSAMCKEIAKDANGGEGTTIISLIHTSGDQNFTLRDTGLRARGGSKIIANLDGYFSTSLLVDPETNNLENDDEILYLPGKFYLRLKDKRTPAGVISNIVSLDAKTLKLKIENCDPNEYEVKVAKKQR